MSEQLQSPSKRALFKTAAAVAATLATGSLVACQQQPENKQYQYRCRMVCGFATHHLTPPNGTA